MLKLRLSFSLLALIAANMVPLIGALFFNWDVGLVLALFWIENLIIGGFNLVKMSTVTWRQREPKDALKCAFFVLHYGLFCSVHGTILWDILDFGEMLSVPLFENSSFIFLDIFNDGASVFVSFVDRFEPFIWLGILALTLSHFVSFIENFILRGELFDLTTSKLMGQPYGQIMIMHAGLIAGAFALEKLGSPIWLLAIIVTLKIVVDCVQHDRRHKEKMGSNPNVITD